jgi:hypothetical protein
MDPPAQSEMHEKHPARFFFDLLRTAPGNPGQVETENENSERYRHKKRAYPEAPISMHPSPVRTWIA